MMAITYIFMVTSLFLFWWRGFPLALIISMGLAFAFILIFGRDLLSRKALEPIVWESLEKSLKGTPLEKHLIELKKDGDEEKPPGEGGSL
jgi:hypothetical protein